MTQNRAGRVLLYLAGVVVVIVVIWGFSLIGSPAFNRKISADKNRIDDLQNIRYQVESSFSDQLKLPQSLKDLDKDRHSSYLRLEDPVSNSPYEYRVLGEFEYELCAIFDLTSKDAQLERRRYDRRDDEGDVWSHDVGRSCFKFEVPVGKRKRDGR